MRAAAKLLLVALAKFREHGGSDWALQVEEYVAIAREDPDRLARIIAGNRDSRAM